MKQNNIIFKIHRISSFNISLWRKKNDPELQGRNILSWDNKISTINNLNKIALKITKRWKKKKKRSLNCEIISLSNEWNTWKCFISFFWWNILPTLPKTSKTNNWIKSLVIHGRRSVICQTWIIGALSAITVKPIE